MFGPHAWQLKWRWFVCIAPVLLLVPSAYLFWEGRDVPQLGQFEDDGLYFTAAKSLAEGHGYRILSVPGEPYQTKYPPLYPLLLAVAWKIDPVFPHNLGIAVAVNWILWLMFLSIAFLFIRSCGLRRQARWAAWALIAISPMCAYIGLHLLSETLFSALLFAALLCAERSPSSRNAILSSMLAGLLGGAAYLTRSAALPLLLAAPPVYLWRKQYARAISFFSAMAPFIAGWAIWTGSHRTPASDPLWLYYTDYLGFYRLNVQPADLPRLFVTSLPPFINAVSGSIFLSAGLLLGSCFSLLSIIGTVRLIRDRRFTIIGLFAIGYSAEVLLWNFRPTGRALYPLAPLVAAGFVYETCRVIRLFASFAEKRRGGNLIHIAGRLIAATVILVFLFKTLEDTSQKVPGALMWHRAIFESRNAAYMWINTNIPYSNDFAAYNDTGLYLYTGRHSYRKEASTRSALYGDLAARERPITDLSAFARKHNLKYILWSPDDYEYEAINFSLRDQLLKQNKGLKLIYDVRRVRIYALN